MRNILMIILCLVLSKPSHAFISSGAFNEVVKKLSSSVSSLLSTLSGDKRSVDKSSSTKNKKNSNLNPSKRIIIKDRPVREEPLKKNSNASSKNITINYDSKIENCTVDEIDCNNEEICESTDSQCKEEDICELADKDCDEEKLVECTNSDQVACRKDLDCLTENNCFIPQENPVQENSAESDLISSESCTFEPSSKPQLKNKPYGDIHPDEYKAYKSIEDINKYLKCYQFGSNKEKISTNQNPGRITEKKSSFIKSISQHFSFPPQLSSCIFVKESSFNPHVVSDTGAIGYGQYMPSAEEKIYTFMQNNIPNKIKIKTDHSIANKSPSYVHDCAMQTGNTCTVYNALASYQNECLNNKYSTKKINIYLTRLSSKAKPSINIDKHGNKFFNSSSYTCQTITNALSGKEDNYLYKKINIIQTKKKAHSFAKNQRLPLKRSETLYYLRQHYDFKKSINSSKSICGNAIRYPKTSKVSKKAIELGFGKNGTPSLASICEEHQRKYTSNQLKKSSIQREITTKVLDLMIRKESETIPVLNPFNFEHAQFMTLTYLNYKRGLIAPSLNKVSERSKQHQELMILAADYNGGSQSKASNYARYIANGLSPDKSLEKIIQIQGEENYN